MVIALGESEPQYNVISSGIDSEPKINRYVQPVCFNFSIHYFHERRHFHDQISKF